MDTKLQYLHKTTTNSLYRVLNYKGSGIYWKKHLNKHGNNIRSVILEIANTPAEFLEKVAKYNEKWQIGQNKSFANLIPETGDRWYTTNDNTSDSIDNYSTKLSNNRYKFNATPAGKENLRRIGDKKRAKAQTPEGKLFYKQLGVMCSKSQKGKTMKERLNNPTYIDPRKNKKFCEIYKEGMSHAQQRPFKICNTSTEEEWICNNEREFKEQLKMCPDPTLRQLKRDKQIIIKHRRSNSSHKFNKGDILTFEYIQKQ